MSDTNREPQSMQGMDLPTAMIAAIEPTVHEWLDAVDDALFEMAEHAGSGESINEYMDDLKSFRRARQQAADAFLDALDLASYHFAAGQPCVDWEDAEELRPRNDDDPWADLAYALSDLQSRAERRSADALEKMYQRLGEIRGSTPPNHQGAPCSPGSLCLALQQSLDAAGMSMAGQLVAAKLYGRNLLDGLDERLHQIDELMTRPREEHEPELMETLERGARMATQIFSQVRGLVMRRQDESTEPLPKPEPEPESETDQPEPADASSDSAEPPTEEAPTEQPVAESATTVEVELDPLLDALAVLQARAAQEQLDLCASAGIDGVKSAVLAQVERQWDQAQAPTLSPDHETAMELAGMVFDCIREDPHLSPALQLMMGRLQIPYVKAALLQPDVFAQADHPARKLLDNLADAASGFSEQAEPGSDLYDKMNDVVERILNDFEDDFSLFEQLQGVFGRYLSQLRRTAEQAKRRAAHLDAGQERVREARTQAARAIGELTRDAELPDPIRNLLRRPWVNAMTLTWLRHGGESSEWRQALQFVEDLLWTLQPKESAADVARLQSMLPAVSRELGNGLDAVAVPKADMKELFEALREIYRDRVGERYRDTLHLPESYGRRVTFMAKPVTRIQKPQAPASDKPAKPVRVPTNEEVWQEAVRGLQTGSWFDLKTEEGTMVRAKLSWLNPITQTLLFVNEDGLKLANKSIEDFANELRSGEAEMLENVPLFERAMAAISERLKAERAGP